MFNKNPSLKFLINSADKEITIDRKTEFLKSGRNSTESDLKYN